MTTDGKRQREAVTGKFHAASGMWHVAPGWLPCVAFVCTAKVTFGMSFSSFYICLNYGESRGKAQKAGLKEMERKAKLCRYLRKSHRRKTRVATVSVCVRVSVCALATHEDTTLAACRMLYMTFCNLYAASVRSLAL